MTSMSIILLVRSLNYGGAERQLVELAKGLHTRGLRVVVLVFYPGGPLLEELERAGIRVSIIGKRGRWDLIGFFSRLVRDARSAHAHVIYSFLVEPGIVAVALKPFVPGLRVTWGVRASDVDRGVYDWPTRASFKISSWLARFADLIIVNSAAGADVHEREGYPRKRIVVLPNGVDAGRFKPDPDAGRRMRADWGVPASESVVGVVARIDPMKDHATLLEAAAILRRDACEPWFVCVGEGRATYVDALRSSARALGISDRVLWVGSCGDMTAAYNAFDIVCSSSAFGEGWSNVLGEAMACGVTCVATDVGDASVIVGDVGVLVPPKDPRALADGIRVALSRAKGDVKGACRERIVTLFGIDRMVEETERLLRKCVDDTA